ncbi:MAG: ABC transporter ATP-binding protein [Clostridia bacterium]|nr:ABC transporter ATP-binding protein [Clostridia bacterium]
MTYTKATMRAVDKYVKNNYDSFLVRVPKGRKQAVEAHAKSKGESVNGLVNALLRADMGLSEEEWKTGPEAEI